MNIPICLITDNNYVMPTIVCLESMYRNKSNTSRYIIHVLSDNISKESYEKIKEYDKENFIVNIIEVENKYKDLQNKNDYVTNSAFLKFDIPNILNEYDKILYIDTDTIILKDLTTLYSINISDTYAGVVLDVGEIFYKTYKKLSLTQYFNSGVILFNAIKYRKENLAEKLIKIYKDYGESFICHDQDTFNIGFAENITLLSPIYNFQQTIFEFPRKKVNDYYKNDINKILSLNNIHIMHYTRMKPWIYKFSAMQKLWFEYYKLSNTYNENSVLKQGLILKYYFIIRNYYNLRFLNQILKFFKRRKNENNN